MADKHIEKLAQEISVVESELEILRQGLVQADPSLIISLQAQIRQTEEHWRQLQYAYKRARRGDYLLCEDCNQPINPARLEIYPQATRCIRCEQARKNRFKSRRPVMSAPTFASV